MAVSQPAPRRKRSAGLKVLAFANLLIGLGGWLRLVEVIRNAEFYTSLNLQPGLWYFIASGVFFGVLGLPAAAGLWLRRRWGIALAAATLLVWLGWDWFERLVLARSPQFSNLPFSLFASLALVWLAGWVLWKEWKTT
ncbi:MAG: hypothetical protein AB1522_09855 [Chloroflexota bacterium]